MAHDEDRLGADSAPAVSSSGLTPEDIAYMKAVQKKRFKFTIVIGIIIMILGFFAGRHIAEARDDSQAMDVPSQSVVLDVQHVYDQREYGVEREEVAL